MTKILDKKENFCDKIWLYFRDYEYLLHQRVEVIREKNECYKNMDIYKFLLPMLFLFNSCELLTDRGYYFSRKVPDDVVPMSLISFS